MATKFFQLSAGSFAHLKGMIPSAIPQEPTPDLNPETLQVLSNLMVGQAQELFVIKAIRGEFYVKIENIFVYKGQSK